MGLAGLNFGAPASSGVSGDISTCGVGVVIDSSSPSPPPPPPGLGGRGAEVVGE